MYLALTNFSRRQPEYDGDPPYIWEGEEVTPEIIEAMHWTPDEVELYIGMGALAEMEAALEPEPTPAKQRVRTPLETFYVNPDPADADFEDESEVNDGHST